MTEIITCKNITLSLSNRPILKDISFTLYEDEDLIVMGPNGAGKTLLLTLLTGNLQPTSGSVYIYGQELKGDNSVEIKKSIGLVSPTLFGDYDYSTNVNAVVMSGLFGSIGVCNNPIKKNNNVVREYINRIISEKYGGYNYAIEYLEKLHIAHLSNYQFGELSYGQKVRVLIARALIVNPRLLILDEPTTGLDISMKHEFLNIVKSLSENMDIVYVTHFVDEVLPFFKKALLLKNGSILNYGDVVKVINSINITNLFDVEVSVNHLNNQYLLSFLS